MIYALHASPETSVSRYDQSSASESEDFAKLSPLTWQLQKSTRHRAQPALNLHLREILCDLRCCSLALSYLLLFLTFNFLTQATALTTFLLETRKTTNMVATASCPLCRKRYNNSFLPLHAASCKLPPKPSAKKSAITKKQSSKHHPILSPRFSVELPSNAAPSERGASGFHVFENIFTHLDAALLAQVEQSPPHWTDIRFRLTKNYGPVYDLSARRFRFGKDAPKELPLPPYAYDTVVPVLRGLHPLLKEFQPNQLAVGKYSRDDSHIKPHNDCENGHIHTGVVGVCLGAACTMTLVLRAKENGLGRDVKRDVRLPRGCVYVMSGDALRVWQHAIFAGKTEGSRISLTFRDVEPHRPEEETKWPIRGRSSTIERNLRYRQSELRI